MKRLHLSRFLGLIFAFFISTLAYAQTLTTQEKDYTFVIRSLQTLKKEHDVALANQVRAKYPTVESTLQNDFKKAKSSKKSFRFARIFRVYQKIKNLYYTLEDCPKVELKAPKYSSRKFTKYRIRGAEEHYLAGIEWLSQKNRTGGKRALHHFQETEKLKTNFRDNHQKLKQAWNMAAYRVLIHTDFTPLTAQNINIQDFEQSLQQYFENQTLEQPVQFVLPHEIKSGTPKKPDHILNLKFNYFSVGQTYVKAENQRISATTKYYAYKKRVRVQGSFIVKILEYETNKDLINQPLTEQYTWLTEWGICKGNTSELSSVQKRFCQLSEQKRPSDTQLFQEFCRVAYPKITSQINEFYNSNQ